MTKIAYDLDGVLVPDCDLIPGLGGLKEFYQATTYMRPLFVPSGDYWIITARPKEYQYLTDQWCSKYLNNPPLRLFHDPKGYAPAEYKARVLNEHPEIQVYIESDQSIADGISKLVTTGCRVIHYATWVAKGLTDVYL